MTSTQAESVRLIETLSNAGGVSGFEDQVIEIIKSHWQGQGPFEEDRLRNLYLYRRENQGGRPLVMIDAHADEVGFIIQAIHKNGTLRFLPIGGWQAQVVLGQKVRIRSADGGDVPGVVAAKPPHFMAAEEKGKLVEIKDMLIDIGATSKEEVTEQFRIQVGAPVVPDAWFTCHPETGVMMGKAFDCRIGCAAVVETLKRLRGLPLQVDVAGTISTQEEVGLRGAKVSARKVRPDVAVAFEGTPADDTFLEEDLIQGGMKRGPQIRHLDSSMIANPRFVRFAAQIADRMGISYQTAVRSAGGTDASVINLSREGVPAIVISVPVRYAHAPYGYAALSDYSAAVAWCCEIVKSLDRSIIDGF